MFDHRIVEKVIIERAGEDNETRRGGGGTVSPFKVIFETDASNAKWTQLYVYVVYIYINDKKQSKINFFFFIV